MVQERKHQDGENANLELSSVLSIFLCSLSHNTPEEHGSDEAVRGGMGGGRGRSMGGLRLLSLKSEPLLPLKKVIH